MELKYKISGIKEIYNYVNLAQIRSLINIDNNLGNIYYPFFILFIQY